MPKLTPFEKLAVKRERQINATRELAAARTEELKKLLTDNLTDLLDPESARRLVYELAEYIDNKAAKDAMDLKGVL